MERSLRWLCAVAVALALGACDSTAPPPPLDGLIEGTIHAEGQALSGVLIQLQDGLGNPAGSTLSGSDGGFAFEGLDEGDYTLLAAALPDRVEAQALSATTTLDRQRPTRRVDLAATLRRDASIVVQIVVEGLGLAGIDVTIDGPESATRSTDASGTAEFTGLLWGEFEITVSGFDPERWAFPATEDMVDADGTVAAHTAFEAIEIPRVPDAPTAFTATATSAHRVELSWTDASDNEETFELERRQGEGDWESLDAAAAETTAAADEGRTPATVYGYRLRACNEHGCSEPWALAEATTPDVPPATPTDLAASGDGADAIDVSWTDASANEDQFDVQRRIGAGGQWADIAQLGADVVALRDGGLAEGTEYGYRVRACNEVGCSEWTDPVSASTAVLPPEAPTTLSAQAPAHDHVQLNWQPGGGSEASHFVLERRIASAPWRERASPAAAARAMSDMDVGPAKLYSYRIRSCNDAGCSEPSPVATIRTPDEPVNLTIGAAYIVQRVQRTAGDVPLVAGVDGLLRVFPLATRNGTSSTPIRVDFLQSGSIVQTSTIAAPSGVMPTGIDESSLSSSWNLAVPGSLIQPGLAVRITVDPDAEVAEGDEGDNAWPNSGPWSLDVRATPTFEVTFVPVRHTATGSVGNVGPHNGDSYMANSRAMLPFANDDVAYRAEYVTSLPALGSDGSNWSALLSEVAALRSADGSSRAYYGVVSPGYGGGVAGIGYVGWPISLGWDRGSSRGSIAAHEWGHNFGRRHSPGCGAGNPDGSYPHAGGRIGAWGYDVGTGSLKSPSSQYDFMTYCGPEWISDYVFERILDFRGPATTPGTTPAANVAVGAPVDGLLVWGRVDDGELILEPAFEVRAPSRLPTAPGRLRLEGRTDDGVAFSLSFDPVSVADLPNPEGHFAFVVPLDRARGPLRSLHLSDGVRETGRTRPPARAAGAGTGPELRIESVDASRAEITWDAARSPMALVRDADTGEILSFARGGRIAVAPNGRRLEVTLSDGVSAVETRTTRWR